MTHPTVESTLLMENKKADEDKNSEPVVQRGKEIKKKVHCIYPECKTKLEKNYKLQVHLCMHTGERPFACDFKDCDKAYTSSSHLNRHKLTHSEIKEIFPCKVCNRTFTTSHNSKRHYKRWHDPSRLDNIVKKCKICQAEFSMVKLLEKHLYEVHDKNMYECEICSKTFITRTKLKMHLESSVHMAFHCEICPASFKLQQELEIHQQEHLMENPRFICDTCGKVFQSKSNLRVHIMNHMEVNIIMCSYEGCNRIYYFQRNLNQHIRTFHMGEKWVCPSCPAQLSSKQKLKNHIRLIHEEPMSRKQPAVKEYRKRRKDAGKPKKSAISHLIGLSLPKETEEKIMNRDIRFGLF